MARRGEEEAELCVDGVVQGLQLGSSTLTTPASSLLLEQNFHAVTSITELATASPTHFPRFSQDPPSPTTPHTCRHAFKTPKYRHVEMWATQHIHTGTQTYMFRHVHGQVPIHVHSTYIDTPYTCRHRQQAQKNSHRDKHR